MTPFVQLERDESEGVVVDEAIRQHDQGRDTQFFAERGIDLSAFPKGALPTTSDKTGSTETGIPVIDSDEKTWTTLDD